jgi:hypothetical protein
MLRMKGGFKAQTTICRDPEGNMLNKSEQVKHRWKEYFLQLLNLTGVEEDQEDPPCLDQKEDTIAPPTEGEICVAVDKLRNSKAP